LLKIGAYKKFIGLHVLIADRKWNVFWDTVYSIDTWPVLCRRPLWRQQNRWRQQYLWWSAWEELLSTWPVTRRAAGICRWTVAARDSRRSADWQCSHSRTTSRSRLARASPTRTHPSVTHHQLTGCCNFERF